MQDKFRIKYPVLLSAIHTKSHGASHGRDLQIPKKNSY